jgi:hypothetical protein
VELSKPDLEKFPEFNRAAPVEFVLEVRNAYRCVAAASMRRTQA